MVRYPLLHAHLKPDIYEFCCTLMEKFPVTELELINVLTLCEHNPDFMHTAIQKFQTRRQEAEY